MLSIGQTIAYKFSTSNNGFFKFLISASYPSWTFSTLTRVVPCLWKPSFFAAAWQGLALGNFSLELDEVVVGALQFHQFLAGAELFDCAVF